MEYLGLILSVLSGIGSLVGLYVVVKIDHNSLKGRVDHLEHLVESLTSERKDLALEMKEMKEVMQQLLLKLTKLETLQEISQKKNEAK